MNSDTELREVGTHGRHGIKSIKKTNRVCYNLTRVTVTYSGWSHADNPSTGGLLVVLLDQSPL